MKFVFAFDELTPALQAAAVTKVAHLAVLRAEYCGEVWVEDSRALAERARFYVINRSCIWSVTFAHPPRVVPGTEFHPERRAA